LGLKKRFFMTLSW
jgi:hypothetical protein